MVGYDHGIGILLTCVHALGIQFENAQSQNHSIILQVFQISIAQFSLKLDITNKENNGRNRSGTALKYTFPSV